MDAKTLNCSFGSENSTSDVRKNSVALLKQSETNFAGNISNFLHDTKIPSPKKGVGIEKWGKREEEDRRSQIT